MDFFLQGQPDPQSEFQDIQCYTERPCLFKKKKKEKRKERRKKEKEGKLQGFFFFRLTLIFFFSIGTAFFESLVNSGHRPLCSRLAGPSVTQWQQLPVSVAFR